MTTKNSEDTQKNTSPKEELEAVSILNDQAEVIWVDINRIIPNPMNPRKNDSIKTSEMQSIIQKRGWEEPLTAYKQGKLYVLLAGHRRLYAAKKVGTIKKVPVFLVDKPETEQEEIERIASLQSGRVDWTPYEWARFTYDRWIAWGRPPIGRFAKQININRGTVDQYIAVLDYFPMQEIELELQNKTVSISSLDSLVRWIRNLKEYKPDLVESMSENLIRKMMLDKVINRKVTRDDLRNIAYIKEASFEDIQAFLIDKDTTLDEQLSKLGIEKKYKDFNGHLISIGLMEKRLPDIAPKTEHQREQAIKALEDLDALIQNRLKEIKKEQ